MNDLWINHQVVIAVIALALFLVAFSNIWALKSMSRYPGPKTFPRVSLLVPARNEENNIETCIRSLLAQDYPEFEVLALDDDSSDNTWRVLQSLAREDPRLRIIKGKPLPEGWLGKHWACHQLVQSAEGQLLLFTDADTQHHPMALRDAVGALLDEGADLLTAMPREKVITWGERLVVPIMHWGISSLLPVGLAHRLKNPLLSVSIGQFMLFDRQAYEHIGGHASVRQHPVDDVMLGRRIKAHGLKWRLVDGNDRVSCRMYRDFRGAFAGFTKHIFPTFDYAVLPFALALIILVATLLEPPAALVGGLLGCFSSGTPLLLAGVAVAAALASWFITCWRFRFPLYIVLLYPLIILIVIIIALRSLSLSLSGHLRWKGRTLAKQRISLW